MRYRGVLRLLDRRVRYHWTPCCLGWRRGPRDGAREEPRRCFLLGSCWMERDFRLAARWGEAYCRGSGYWGVARLRKCRHTERRRRLQSLNGFMCYLM